MEHPPTATIRLTPDITRRPALSPTWLARMRRLADSRGNNLLEGAIITPLMIFMTFSIIDLSSLLYTYLALENGVSQATRFAVTGNVLDDPDAPGSKLSRQASIVHAMRNATPTLTIPDNAVTFSHLVPGTNVWVNGPGAPSDIEKVSVQYSWAVLSPVLRPFFDGGRMTLKVQSSMKNEGRFE